LTHVTSPFLKKKTIFDAIGMLHNNSKSKSIHSVELIQNFVWIKKDCEASPVNFFTDRVQRTQDLAPILVSRGAFFIAKAGDILDQRQRLPDPVIYYPLGHIEGVDIDNFDDSEFAKLLKGKE
jgi:CMP-N-acetylneuraminic acid synthetase